MYLNEWLIYIYFWTSEIDHTSITNMIDISSTTTTSLNLQFLTILSNSLKKIDLRIGGEGEIVEIDETFFGKINKYFKGKQYDQVWFFGGIERSSGKIFGEFVEERSSKVLIPIIQKYILPKTIIISDELVKVIEDCLVVPKNQRETRNPNITTFEQAQELVKQLNESEPHYGLRRY